MAFRKCDECETKDLSDCLNIIKCDNHKYVKSVCDSCNFPNKQKSDNNWQSRMLEDFYGINLDALKYSDINYYEKRNGYTIIQINDNQIIKCDNCILDFIKNNLQLTIQECDICCKKFNNNKLIESLCYGKCNIIMDICETCYNDNVVDYSDIGLGKYLVCFLCIDDYTQNMKRIFQL